jgi:hypothetical protein
MKTAYDYGWGDAMERVRLALEIARDAPLRYPSGLKHADTSWAAACRSVADVLGLSLGRP